MVRLSCNTAQKKDLFTQNQRLKNITFQSLIVFFFIIVGLGCLDFDGFPLPHRVKKQISPFFWPFRIKTINQKCLQGKLQSIQFKLPMPAQCLKYFTWYLERCFVKNSVMYQLRQLACRILESGVSIISGYGVARIN